MEPTDTSCRKRSVQIGRICGVLSLAASAVFLVYAFCGSPIMSFVSSLLDGVALFLLGIALLFQPSRRAIAGVLILSFVALSYSNEVYLLCTGRGRWFGFILLTVWLLMSLLVLFGVIKSDEAR